MLCQGLFKCFSFLFEYYERTFMAPSLISYKWNRAQNCRNFFLKRFAAYIPFLAVRKNPRAITAPRAPTGQNSLAPTP